MSVLNLLINSILQVVLFTAIPFIWWAVFWRKKEPFFRWLGFKKIKIENKVRFTFIFVMSIIVLCLPGLYIIPYFTDVDLATNQFYGLGIKALIPAFIYAFIQTSLSEEILFKGFLTKRLANKFGFQIGNAIQSLLFGLMHGAMLIANSNILGAFAVILFTSIAGWLMGWINEKECNGSILSSWLLHGIVNSIASMYIAFSMY